MKVWLLSATLLAFALTLTHSQDVSVSVGEGKAKGEGGGGLQVVFDVNLPNPCDQYKCEEGSVCVPVVSDLLQLPVPHCVESEEGKTDDLCSSYEVGTSIVTCKTESQWRDAGRSKCTAVLGGGSASVAVRHPCHRRTSSSPSIFLQAAITCCPSPATGTPAPTTEAPPTTTETPPTTTEAPPTTTEAPPTDDVSSPPAGYEKVEEEEQQEEEEEEEEEEVGEDGRHDTGTGMLFVALTTGVLVLVVVALVIVKVVRWRRRKRLSSPYKPRLQFVTSFVNPSSEGWEEGRWEEGRWEEGGVRSGKCDYSYVVTNQNTLPGKE